MRRLRGAGDAGDVSGDAWAETQPVTAQPTLSGTFKVSLSQVMNDIALTFHFEVDRDAETFFDWLASQSLDSGQLIVALNTGNMRVVR